MGSTPCRQFVTSCDWSDIEAQSGLPRSALEAAADEYMKAERLIVVYGMGLTQHRRGVQNVQMVSNLLLLRGNIGKPGAGICPVRDYGAVREEIAAIYPEIFHDFNQRMWTPGGFRRPVAAAETICPLTARMCYAS
jgi:anaerobic selenocysteine-containing dehydrogenase